MLPLIGGRFLEKENVFASQICFLIRPSNGMNHLSFLARRPTASGRLKVTLIVFLMFPLMLRKESSNSLRSTCLPASQHASSIFSQPNHDQDGHINEVDSELWIHCSGSRHDAIN